MRVEDLINQYYCVPYENEDFRSLL
jgi:hypothetical protein